MYVPLLSHAVKEQRALTLVGEELELNLALHQDLFTG